MPCRSLLSVTASTVQRLRVRNMSTLQKPQTISLSCSNVFLPVAEMPLLAGVSAGPEFSRLPGHQEGCPGGKYSPAILETIRRRIWQVFLRRKWQKLERRFQIGHRPAGVDKVFVELMMRYAVSAPPQLPEQEACAQPYFVTDSVCCIPLLCCVGCRCLPARLFQHRTDACPHVLCNRLPHPPCGNAILYGVR